MGMPYAVKCFFTEEAGKPIRAIWNELSEAGVATFLGRSRCRPGFTLGAWDKEDPERVLSITRMFSQRISTFSVETFGLGQFVTSPAYVFLGIVPSPYLLRIHEDFLRACGVLAREISPFYRAGNWVPHSTLALRCESDKVPRIVQLCLRHPTRLTLEVDSLGMVETESASELCSFSLLHKDEFGSRTG